MEGGENRWSSATDLSWPWPEDDGEMVDEGGEAPTPPPQTPKDPTEFISQPWTLSASEIRQALLSKTKGKASVGRVDPGDMVTVDETFTGRKVAPPRNHLPCNLASTVVDATTTDEAEESAISPHSGECDEGVEMGEDDGCSSVQTMITPPPQSPEEPMDFLAQSWNLSASEITKALLSSINTMNSVRWTTSTEATATKEASTSADVAAATIPYCHPRCSTVGTLWADNDRMEVINEEEELDDSVPAIPPPQTPQESMEFLSRSWRLSTSEITKGLLSNARSRNFVRWIPDTSAVHPHSSISPATMAGGGVEEGCRRWFQPSRKSRRKKAAKKELARANGANVHAAVSVAAVAVAVAAVASSANSESSVSKLSMAIASATELLASHCTDIAEKTGADRQQLAAVVRSTVDVRTASDLMTLTAAAATALRGAAALNVRVTQGESKSNASVNPSDKDHCIGPHILFCKEGHLLKRTKTGALHWKEVSVYINKKLQVMVKLKSRNAGDTFIKKKKCAVYGVCEEVTQRPRRTKIDEENRSFSLRTTKGLIEFECQNEIHKQRWLDAVRNLLSQVSCHGSSLEQSLKVLRISH